MADSQSRNMSQNWLTNENVVRQFGVEFYTRETVARKRCNIKNPVLVVHLFRRRYAGLLCLYGIVQASLQAWLPHLSPHDLWQTAVLPYLVAISVVITDFTETINDVEEGIRIRKMVLCLLDRASSW